MLSSGIHIGRRGGVQLTGGGCSPVYGIEGALVGNETFTHPAQGVFGVTQPTLADQVRIRIRNVSTANYIQISWNLAGNFVVIERVSNVDNIRVNQGGAVTAGARIVVVYDDTAIHMYRNGTLVVTWNTTYLAGETAGSITQTAGGAADFRLWTLACRASEGV